MKSVFALVIGLLVSVSSYAVQDGTYHCATKDNKSQMTFKIGTLTANDLSVTVLEVTRTMTVDDKTVTNVAKGVASHYVTTDGKEYLTLGNQLIELTAGRPSCVQ